MARSFGFQSVWVKLAVSFGNLVLPSFLNRDSTFSVKLALGLYAPGSGVFCRVREKRSAETGNAFTGWFLNVESVDTLPEMFKLSLFKCWPGPGSLAAFFSYSAKRSSLGRML